ncbi:MAG: SRPBCC family protein [Daejeonella sp.]
MNLTSRQSTDGNVNVPERVISIIGGAFLAYKSLGRFKKNPFLAAQEAFAGVMMLHRGATGFCPLYSALDKGSTEQGAVNISESFIVDKPREELYAFWRRLENLPVFMKHLSSVEEHDEKRSHWRANLPGEILKLSWNAEITREEENKYIGWKSVAGSMVENAGEVTFSDAINTSGTELTVDLRYFPPAGSLGQGVARLLNGVFETMVRHDIENFKHYIEGEDYKTYENKREEQDQSDAVVNSFKY